ncbi:MAG: hypothetical protein WC445_01105 [Patescibacteria group bacterium]
MPIKNYTTTVPANRSIEEIQSALVKHGASGVLYEYEKGTGRIAALKFKLQIGEQAVAFSLPVSWRRFQAVLEEQQVKRSNDEDYVYRVSWRNIRDWVLAQLALYETEMVELPQVFLPFATGKDGSTLYDRVLNQGFLLTDGEK